MGENLNIARDALERVQDLLKSAPPGRVPEDELRNVLIRLQFAENALTQNEKKIWLRTKVGKEMLSDFSTASKKLLGAIEGLQKNETGPNFLDDIDAALGDLEHHAKRLNAETSRRSMVVT